MYILDSDRFRLNMFIKIIRKIKPDSILIYINLSCFKSNTRLEYHIFEIYTTVANMQQVAYGSHSGEADRYSMYA